MRAMMLGLGLAACLPAAHAQEARDRVVGRWTGTYTCGQGLTRLDLEVGRGPGPNALTARFVFSAPLTNPYVPSGDYTMTGSMTSLRGFELNPLAWGSRPDGYEMVALRGEGDQSAQVLAGRIPFASCTTFRLERVRERVA